MPVRNWPARNQHAPAACENASAHMFIILELIEFSPSLYEETPCDIRCGTADSSTFFSATEAWQEQQKVLGASDVRSEIQQP